MRSSRPFIILALLIGGFALLIDQRHVIASGIQALATVAAGGTGLTTLTPNAVMIGNGTAPVLLAASPNDNTQALCGANPPAFGTTCKGSGGGGINVYSGTGLMVAANTYFFPIGGGGTPSTTEANVDVEAPSAATITNFYAQLSVALGAGNTGVFTWRKAGVNQSVTCTVTGAAQTSCNDLTHSFTVAQGDLIDIQLVTTGTIVVTPNLVMSVQFGTTGSNGTVNTGTVGQCAYYAATGTAVSGVGSCAPALPALFVTTNETTVSNSYVDLATLDSVTFVLLATTDISIQYLAEEYNDTAAIERSQNIVNIDGSDVAATETLMDIPTNSQSMGFAADVVSLAAGSHTIKIRHLVGGGTGHWQRRQLIVRAVL
jgi:hypothetical protein